MADGPVGDVFTAIGRFTHCVPKATYKNPVSFGVDAGLGALGKDLCDYVNGGKLICLAGGGQRCAVGTVVHIEPVGYEKSGYELIDNDFSINLLLFPHTLDTLSDSLDIDTQWAAIRDDGMQGGLLNQDQTASVTPRDPGDHPNRPYTRTFLFGDPAGRRPYEPKEDPTDKLEEEIKQDIAGIKRVPVPVLHCEFEGSGVFAVCAAIAPFLDLATGGPGSGACRAALGWIPFVGDLICTIIETIITILLAPIIALVALAALAASYATDAAAITGPASRAVALNDTVIVTGRWVWDGGHSGYNEFHATFTLQQVVLPDPVGLPVADVNTLVSDWCALVSDAPPTGEAGQPLTTGLTPGQQENADNQNKPEHGWVFHPAIDGCLPEPEPEPDPIEVPK
jgi:hypothetical protein